MNPKTSTKLNIPKLVRDWERTMARLPRYPEETVGSLTLRTSHYERGEIARFYDPRVGRLMYGKYPKRATFANLVEKRETDGFEFTWMSADQCEISGMDAHAKAAYGDVLIAGLGLGVLPWLAAKNSNVRTVTVVEIRPEVIDLVAPVVENEKIRVISGDVWEHIGRWPGAYDFIDLDIWSDIAEAVLTVGQTQRACAKALKRGGIVRTWMDDMAFRLTHEQTLYKISLAMANDKGRLFIQPAIQTKYPCEFCGTVYYADCYRLCMECCGNLTLPFQVGGIVHERFMELVENAHRGQLDNILMPNQPDWNGYREQSAMPRQISEMYEVATTKWLKSRE